MSTLILRVAARLLFPWMVLYSLYLLGGGQQNVGGGFIGGVLVGMAISLIYVGLGREFVKKALPVSGLHLVALGLAIAAGTGLAAVALGFPFLTSHFLTWQLPFLGEVPLISSALFDVGIYFTVIGVLLTVLATIGSD